MAHWAGGAVFPTGSAAPPPFGATSQRGTLWAGALRDPSAAPIPSAVDGPRLPSPTQDRPEQEESVSESSPGFGRIFAVLFAFLLVGAPLVYFAWHYLSDLVAGQGTFGNTLIALAALAAFIVLAGWLKGWIAGLESDH